MKVAFFVTTPPGDEPRVQTMLGYALAARAMDYEVLIFLALDGAIIIKRKVVESYSPETRSRIEDALKDGVKMWVCSAAVKTYGIQKDEMIDGVEVTGIASFYEFAADSKITLSW